MKVLLSEMETKKMGVVVGIDGGKGIVSRLSTLGIRQGVELKKISQQAMGGPVVAIVGRTQIAVGFGMAKRILVEIDKEEVE
jgi:ferrous iron transport protein A